MTRSTFATLTLLALLAAGPVRGGTISIASSSPTAMVGQTVTLTVSIDVTDPSPPPSGDYLTFARGVPTTNAAPATLNNFVLAPDVPSGSSLTVQAPPAATLVLFPIFNGLSSFDGALFQFDFTPDHRGLYTFAFPDASTQMDEVYFLGGAGAVYLDPGLSASIMVFGSTAVPEPTGLALAGVCLGGLALRGWRKRYAA